MRDRFVVAAVVLLAWSCAVVDPVPPGENEPTVLTLGFTADSAQHYIPGGSSCGLYCRAWAPDSAKFDGVLTLGNDTATFGAFKGPYTMTGGHLTAVLAGSGPGCNYFGFNGTMAAFVAAGTWNEQMDCHGLSRAGHFSTK